MLIAFHLDPKRQKRDVPYLWKPKNGDAGLNHDATEQETFIQLHGIDTENDVQLKLRPDAIIARRDGGIGWSGVMISDDTVQVIVGDMKLEIRPDGSVARHDNDGSSTFLEGDGSIIKLSAQAQITVSSDGGTMRRRTEDRIEAITPDGVVSKGR